MNPNLPAIVAKYSSGELQHIMRTLNAELEADMLAGVKGTQQHAGKLEMLAAMGAELSKRKAPRFHPSYFDTCMEDGIRYSIQVRVF